MRDQEHNVTHQSAIERRAKQLHDCWCAWFHATHPNSGHDDGGPYNLSYEQIADKSWYRYWAEFDLDHLLPPGMTLEDLRRIESQLLDETGPLMIPLDECATVLTRLLSILDPEEGGE
jgi:hypothetical protein